MPNSSPAQAFVPAALQGLRPCLPMDDTRSWLPGEVFPLHPKLKPVILGAAKGLNRRNIANASVIALPIATDYRLPFTDY